MTLETFFEKFDQFADAPNAVARMRRFVLDLAVRGKLVAQNPKDEPADELLKRVQAEKARLIKSGDIKKQELLPPVTEDAIPFSLPAGWAPSQLGDVAVCLDYMREPINGTERDLRIAGKAQSELFPYYGATQQQGWIDDYIFDDELVLLGEDGVPFFNDLRAKAYLILGKTWVNNHAHVFRGILVSNSFLMHWLNTFDYTGRVAGSTRSKLNQAKAVGIPIALPPLAEQKRIVAKVDELMALCDRLAMQQQERETRHAALARASLARFADAPTPANLHFIFHPSYAIPPADLRKSILTLAVQGKLVPQDPNDEPAEELITAVRNAALESGYRGRTNSEDDNNPKFAAHVPDDLPPEWSVCPLEDLFRFIDYRGRTPVRRPSGVRLITAKNVKKGFISNEPVEFIDEDVYPKWMTRGFPKMGDLLFVTEGHTMGFVGTLNFDFKYALAQRTIDLQPFCDGYGPFYLYYLLSEPFQTAVVSNTTGSAAQGIKAAKLKRIRVIVPPLAEQRRIVAKVEQLMALVDALETQLAASRATAANLLSALVAELTTQNTTYA